jgi:hypothetical protein
METPKKTGIVADLFAREMQMRMKKDSASLKRMKYHSLSRVVASLKDPN